MTQRGPTTFNPLVVAQQTLDTPLARILADRIQRDGPLTFADWMQACLYHPQHGYYRRGRPTVGRVGDFLTSPEVHPLFGAAVGHVAIEHWTQAGRPEPFQIAEIGPGTAALAESLLRHLHATAPEMAAATRYTLVEPDGQAHRRQRERLQLVHHDRLILQISSLDQLDSQHLIIANELLDALAVHRLLFRDGRWQEIYVDYSLSHGFHEAAAESSATALLEPLADLTPGDGQVAEVAPQRAATVRALAEAVADGGLLLLFDYGYPRGRLYAPWRRAGTLMTFRNHIPGDDPYAHPGEQDITAHIDIDQVNEAAQDAGLTALPTLTQAEWLHNLGAAVLPAVADAGIDASRYLSARRAVETLTDPGGLGRIAVMGFTRGSNDPLTGWASS